MANTFLFPKLKTLMKGKRFVTIEEIKEKSTKQLAGDSKNRVSEVFQGFRGLEKFCLNRRIQRTWTLLTFSFFQN